MGTSEDRIVGLLRAIDVYHRTCTGELVVYRCFQSLDTDLFAVQSADFIDARDLTRMEEHKVQYWELLREQDPGERGGQFASLKEAIDDFNSAFED